MCLPASRVGMGRSGGKGVSVGRALEGKSSRRHLLQGDDASPSPDPPASENAIGITFYGIPQCHMNLFPWLWDNECRPIHKSCVSVKTSGRALIRCYTGSIIKSAFALLPVSDDVFKSSTATPSPTFFYLSLDLMKRPLSSRVNIHRKPRQLATRESYEHIRLCPSL